MTVDPLNVSIEVAKAKEKVKKQKVETVVAPSRVSYFDSTDACLLFNPMPGESVLQCLSRRVEMLKAASFDDSLLEEMVEGIDSLSELTAKQKERLRMQCLCLKQAHESAVQFMNDIKWKACCQHAVEEIQKLDIGIKSVKNGATIRRWNIQFRKGERFEVSNMRARREPKIFTLFPELREKLVTHCNKQIREGSLSTEACTLEVKNKLIPDCYQDLLEEAGEDKGDMPTHNEILSMCDLTTITVPTVWRWMLQMDMKGRMW